MKLPVLPARSAEAPPRGTGRSPPFHVLAKPIGPACNLDCEYCYYLQTERLYPGREQWRMPDEVLEAFVRQYIAGQDAPEVNFAWQGGEPTLAGLDFYRRVVALQAEHAGGKKVNNALQTNGTLLDDHWCRFLSEHGFLVGLSVDGPRAVNDAYRVDKKGAGSFDAVVRGIELLKKHGTPFHTLTVVSRANQDRPLEVYRFLKGIGSTVHQYIPLVSRLPDEPARRAGVRVAGPAGPDDRAAGGGPPAVTAWSVQPLAYGEFLCGVFDEWVRRDVGRTFVQVFEVMLGVWAGMGSSLCVFAERCGRAVAVEHNGDVYACDHYVRPEFKLGNLLGGSLGGLVGGPAQRAFGDAKADALPRYCRSCDVRFACNGECPKNRFAAAPDGEPGLNYLCAGYRRFFRHVDPYMTIMADLLRRGRPPASIMALLREAAGPPAG